MLYITLLAVMYCGLVFALRRGVNRWRDHLLPSDILSNICKLQSVPGPMWTTNSSVKFKGQEYTLESFGKTIEFYKVWLLLPVINNRAR